MVKAIGLLSGGLDSILATRMMIEQGVEVEALNFKTVFCTCTARNKTCLASQSAAEALGVKLKVFEISREYFEVVKKPKYGYGSHMNPCLDCRILIFKKAREYMLETGAKFVFTGEVLGERPMSQRKDAMKTIERDSGLKGLVLRPLSAGLLEPTIPEIEGWVDRNKLLSIQGRSRKPQIELARQFGINDYPCPAGGCLLTDPGFANRMKDLMKHKPAFDVRDILLLKIGRHFRLSQAAKLIVGRNQDENRNLEAFLPHADLIFSPHKIKGPLGLGVGEFDEQSLNLASGIVARYSDRPISAKCQIRYTRKPDRTPSLIEPLMPDESSLAQVRI